MSWTGRKYILLTSPWQNCHGLVGSLYFHPVHDNLQNKNLYWAELSTSSKSRIFWRKKTLDWLKVYTSNQSRISIVTPSLEVYTFNQYMDWSEVYNSRLVMVILECLGTFGIQKNMNYSVSNPPWEIYILSFIQRVYYEIHLKTKFISADSLQCP